MAGKRACDACHSRKIQCDTSESDPQVCDWCAHHKLQCTFNRVRGRRKAVTKSRARQGSGKDISERLRRIEDALAGNTRPSSGNATSDETTAASSASTTPPRSAPSAGPTSQPQPSRLGEQLSQYEAPQPAKSPSLNAGDPAAVSIGQIYFAGYHLGQVSSDDGITIFSSEGKDWIRSRTGEDAVFHEQGPLGARNRAYASSLRGLTTPAPSSRHFEMPGRSLVEQCLEGYERLSFRVAFPIIDPVVFRETIGVAYQVPDGARSLEQTRSRACVMAFLSISCIFRVGPYTRSVADPDESFAKAQMLLFEVLPDASLTTLQTLFMLCLHQIFTGRLQSSSMFHALACRACFILGAHTAGSARPVSLPGDTEIDIRSRRGLRVMFWLCYYIDKEIAFRMGQPLNFLADENCDLTLPEGYSDFQNALGFDGDAASPSFDDEAAMPRGPGDLRLSILKSKACRLLYSVQAFKKSDTELLRDVRELDAELEAWRASMPPAVRPSLSIPKNLRLPSGESKSNTMRRVVLHLEYHYLMASIHRASGRCHRWPWNGAAEAERLNNSVLSSMDLSVEASRSTLFYLEAAVHELADEVFWIIIFYPVSAITTIFFHVLLKPLEPQAREDIELVGSAVHLVRNLPVRRLTTHEMAHIKMVSDFIEELVRLGRSAIDKAERERDKR